MAIKGKPQSQIELENNKASCPLKTQRSAQPSIQKSNLDLELEQLDKPNLQKYDTVKVNHCRFSTPEGDHAITLGCIIDCNELSAEVLLWNGTFTFPINELEKIETPKKESEKLYQLLLRLKRLYLKINPESEDALHLQKISENICNGITEGDKRLLETIENMYGNLRRHRRIDFHFDVVYCCENNPTMSYKGQCINFSSQGLYFTKGENLHLKGKLEVFLFPSEHSKGLKCQVEIVREDEEGYGCLFI